MKSFVILTMIAPLVLCRTSYDFGSELTSDQMKEILALKALTEEYTRLNKTYINPLASSIQVSENDVSFYVYNRDDRDGKHVLFEHGADITSYSSFNTNLKTIFIAHGWTNNYHSPVCTLIRDAHLALENVNVIAVDWDSLAAQLYTSSQAAVPSVGSYVGKFITTISENNGYSLDNFIIIGHSLGAHIAGFAGKELNGQASTIIGLDPAGPLYFELLKDQRLNENDAKYVVSIHTDGSILGLNYRVADADFWPNDGLAQPGCGLDVDGICSHYRSYVYYAESVPYSNFIARECSNYILYETGLCRGNTKAVMGGPTINPSVKGNFFLNTNSEAPFAKGE